MKFERPDPEADPIVVEGLYSAPPSRVFDAWTDPAIVKQWFGSKPGALEHAVIDLRPGGRWRFVEHTEGGTSTGFEGEYLEVVRDQLLVFTWAKITEQQRTGHRKSTTYSKVEINFVSRGEGTAMRIVHSNLNTEGRLDFQVGWTKGIASLAELVNGPLSR